MGTRFFLIAALLGAGCSQSSPSPSGPAPVVPSVAAAADFTGVWDLEYKVIDCGSPRAWYCPEIGTRKTLTLRLLQSGGSISGFAFADSTHVPLAGTVQASSDEVVLSGARPSLEEFRPGDEIRNLRVAIAGGVLTGRFEFSNGSLRILVIGEIMSQRSHRPLEVPFSGEWSGHYVRRQCLSPPGVFCSALPLSSWETFRLVLSESAGAVSGLLELGVSRVPFTGSSSGDALTLQGDFESGHGTVRLTARRDGVGGLTGSFTYTTPAGSLTHSDLWYVARRP